MNNEQYRGALLVQVIKALVNDQQPINVRKQLQGGHLTTYDTLLRDYAQGGVAQVRARCRLLCEKIPYFAKLTEGIGFDELPQSFDAATLMDGTGKETRWAVPGLLPEGLTILAGAPKVGKSWLCLDLAIAVATGTPTLQATATEAGDVLYLALEDTERRLRERVRKVLGDRTLPQQLHFISNDQHVPRWNHGGKLFLNQWLDAHPHTRMVVVDTLVKFRPTEQHGFGTYERDYHGVQEMLRMAAQRHIALLVVHHTRKLEAHDAMQTISGSFGLTGGVDGMLLLRRGRGQDNAVLHVTGRDVEEQALALRWDNAATRWSIVGTVAEVTHSTARKAILDALGTDARPMTPKEVWEIIESEDPATTRAAVRQLMYKMRRDGVLEVKDGKYQVQSSDNQQEEMRM
jgi:hypothetical protein